jgi:hypothetical protein
MQQEAFDGGGGSEFLKIWCLLPDGLGVSNLFDRADYCFRNIVVKKKIKDQSHVAKSAVTLKIQPKCARIAEAYAYLISRLVVCLF